MQCLEILQLVTLHVHVIESVSISMCMCASLESNIIVCEAMA